MNKKETKEVQQTLYDAYRGALFASRAFADGDKENVKYQFNTPELKRLNAQYGIAEKAGRGGDFQRAQRLVKWLAPLPHDGLFGLKGVGVEINAPALLEYAQAGNGINCACKAKILQEYCLAINIFARRIVLYPASPYDDDNHVVTEIYDRKLNKWIMLDVTSGGGFYDDKKTPLSCMELRELLADGRRVYFAKSGQNPTNADALYEKNFYWNVYFAKNLYRFEVESVSAFGKSGGKNWSVAPEGYDVAEAKKKNAEYMIAKMQTENTTEFISVLEKRLQQIDADACASVSPYTLTREPDWKQLLAFNLAADKKA